jgi:hypothetical protein
MGNSRLKEHYNAKRGIFLVNKYNILYYILSVG